MTIGHPCAPEQATSVVLRNTFTSGTDKVLIMIYGAERRGQATAVQESNTLAVP